MTVIAWDGTTLAADSLMTFSGSKYYVNKLRKLPGNRIAGAAGNTNRIAQWFKWLEKHGGDAAPLAFQTANPDNCIIGIEVTAKGVWMHGLGGATLITGQTAAIGSGSEPARAVLLLGLTAARAVEIACQVDINCGGDITTLTLD